MKRTVNQFGVLDARYIARSDLVEQEIERNIHRMQRWQRRRLMRLRRRALCYEAAVARAEAATEIEAKHHMLEVAVHTLGDLVEVVFDLPPTGYLSLHLKASALVAFAACGDEGWRKSHAGKWGTQLARELLELDERTGA